MGITDDPRYAAFASEWGVDSPRRMFVFLQNQGLGSIPLAFAIFVAARFPDDALRLQDYVGAVILFVGIVARYVFHSPLIWSDELASALFLWLAMLGSVVALRLGGHMRMTAFVGMLSPPRRLALDVVAIVGALTFLLLILPSAYDFAADEIAVTTPAMQVSDAWRAAALPVGFALYTTEIWSLQS